MASSNLLGKREPNYDLETKPILKRHKENSEEKETTKVFADNPQQIQLLETKSDQANLRPLKETVGGLDYVEIVAARKKTLVVSHLRRQTRISDIIDFFKDVAQVVRVRRFLISTGKYSRYASVEFASANEAQKALEMKNGEYLGLDKITLNVATKPPNPPRPMCCVEHKVWNEDDLRRESFPMEGEEIPPHFFEAVAAREDTLFVANLSPQTNIKHVIKFFKTYTECLRVRLIVNHEGKHVGYGFVEFASAYEAEKALEGKNGKYLHGHKIFLDVAPYAPRPKYSLAEKLWYEDYLLQKSYLIEEDEELEGLDETPNFDEAVALRKKTLSVSNLSRETKMSDIIKFFKTYTECLRVRLIVNHEGKHVGYGYVEFASANEAKKAQEMKNGEYLCGSKITLDVAETALQPMYCLDHKVWYEDYLRRESLLIGEEEAVEVLDEAPDLAEEVAVRQKTLFYTNLSSTPNIRAIINFFKDVGKVKSILVMVDYEGKRLGCGFVEFDSANDAKKALKRKFGEILRARTILLYMAKMAPYPLRPKYNLAEKLWYEDYLQRESLLIEEDDLLSEDDLVCKPIRKREKKDISVFCGKKITFSDDDSE